MQNPAYNSTPRDHEQALRDLLREVAGGNAMYQPLLREAGLDDADNVSLERFLRDMPLTTKQQLVDDQNAHPPYGRNLTYPIDRYTRFCQTSGTTGKPMRVIDTAESWQSLLDVWHRVFTAAGCRAGERILFPFSFGPFLGFWTAYESATQLGMMCLPGGGLGSVARLQLALDNRVGTVCCTPTYAMHLAEVAEREGIDLVGSSVARLIVAGEPGGSIPSVRERIASAWGARVFDHHGMTEVGPVTYQTEDDPDSLRVDERAFLVETIDPKTTKTIAPGQEGELVLTTLRRTAWPLLRYRTGDLVRQDPENPMRLIGGILGRADDMRLVRGVNVYPSAIDAVVRRFDQVAEYEVTLRTTEAMAEISLTIEPSERCDDPDALTRRVGAALHDALSLRVPVLLARHGTLARYEMKARRWREVQR